MGWIRVLVLILSVLLPFVSSAKGIRACIIDSYDIQFTNYVKRRLEEILRTGHTLVSYSQYGCEVKVLLGTPAVVEALKKGERKKVIYTFVMFPELLKLKKRKNFFGIRIFPLPKRTVEKFFNCTGLKREKVAVPVSKDILELARLYLPSELFDIVTFSDDITSIYSKLKNYTYIYIFPDPNVLKVVNMLNIVKVSKTNGKILISGLPDLDKYDVNFVYAVDYDKLVEAIVKLLKETPKERLLPCPARVKVWNH